MRISRPPDRGSSRPPKTAASHFLLREARNNFAARPRLGFALADAAQGAAVARVPGAAAVLARPLRLVAELPLPLLPLLLLLLLLLVW